MPVKVEGLDEVLSTLKGLPLKVQRDVLRIAAAKAASILREEVRYQILNQGLVDTGELFDSIAIRTKVKWNGVTATVHTGKAFYGLFHEFGTRKMIARPFMRPALLVATPQIIEDVGKYIGRAIEVIATKAYKVKK